jgi:lysylphosphatidylglycerol synthetase-like protein (DUF2156 family)
MTMSSALDILAAHAENPAAFLAFNNGTQLFEVPGLDGLIAYRPARRRYLVQLGGPFAADDGYDELLSRFLAFAQAQRRRVVAIQLQQRDALAYARRGFTVNQVGASYAVDLSRFTLAGSKFMQLRNKISKAGRGGVKVREVVSEQEAEGLAGQLDALDREWLRGKGRHVKELRFLIGERGGPHQGERRLFVATVEDRPVGYVSYSPVFGQRRGWMHDLSRRSADAPVGTMEAIVSTSVGVFREEGVGYLHFGFTPFTTIDPQYAVPGASRAVAWIVGMLAKHGAAVYPAQSQLSYKEKWGLHVVLPEYVALPGRPSLSAVWHLARTANVI